MRHGDVLNLPGKISETVLMEFFTERGSVSHRILPILFHP